MSTARELKIADILEKNPVLVTLDQKIKQYEDRIADGTAKDQIHVTNVKYLRKKFNEFIETMANEWYDRPDVSYSDFTKWKNIATAFQIFSKFLNNDQLLSEEIKITAKTKGSSYDSLIIDARSLAADFVSLVQDNLLKAATAQFILLETQDAREEITKARIETSEKSLEVDALKRQIKQSELSERQRLDAPRREIADLKKLQERLEREIERLRNVTTPPELKKLQEMECKLEEANKESAKKSSEIGRLHEELKAAQMQLEASDVKHKAAIKQMQEEHKLTVEKMQDEHKKMLDETVDSIQKQFLELEQRSSAALAEQKEIIAGLRTATEQQRSANQELQKVIGEGAEAFLAERFAEETKSRKELEQQATKLAEENTKLTTALVKLQGSFDVLSDATSALLRKAGQQPLPPIATTTSDEKAGKAVVGAEVGAVKSRHAQARKAVELASVTPQRRRKPMRFFEADEKGQFKEMENPKKKTSVSSADASDSESYTTSSESGVPTPSPSPRGGEGKK